jgi:hypothetical protein
VPAGRPTEYSSEFVQRAADLCANGATDMELADEFDVTVRTIYAWRAKHPEFLHAIRAAKEIADERVERSMYHKAVGFEYTSVKIFMPAGASEPVYAPYREYFPPDTAAAFAWLKNRKPDQWREKSELVVTDLAAKLAEARKRVK